MNKQQSVYVLEQPNGLVKIGIAENVEERVASLERMGGFIRKNLQSFAPVTNAREVEYKIQSAFDASRLIGEWFSISFDAAVQVAYSMTSNYGLSEFDESFPNYVPVVRWLLSGMEQIIDDMSQDYIDNFPIKGLIKVIYEENGETRMVLNDGSDVSYEFLKAMIFTFERGDDNAQKIRLSTNGLHLLSLLGR
ncbi:GIY-YIG nuclease family protein [Streptococcus alactolyticus]|uniref:GIY-YIG nuclease family protein n=1 Tax=Streptococcus alactolyticus TaxID=29389 RepID=UPI003D0675EE